MEENKPRKRVANFTADEKALLAHLIKKRPIIESKLTDGKSILKKKTAWISVTDEFYSNAHVHKRDTQTLKRAWDNLKAMARKTRATERGNIFKTGGGPSNPPPPPQNGAIISLVEEAAPAIICEVKNSLDSDGTALSSIENTEVKKIEILLKDDDDFNKNLSMNLCEIEDSQITQTQNNDLLSDENNLLGFEDGIELCAPAKSKNLLCMEQAEQKKPSDYVRREGVLRIKHFEAKKKIEIQILKAKLENQQIKRRAAEMEEERNKTLLELAKLELEELKKQLC